MWNAECKFSGGGGGGLPVFKKSCVYSFQNCYFSSKFCYLKKDYVVKKSKIGSDRKTRAFAFCKNWLEML